MSTNPPSTVPQSGISKSAAKKRAKKAAARQTSNSTYPEGQIGGVDVQLEYGIDSNQDLDPSLYPYPGQLPVPVGFDFDSNAYYDESELPPDNGSNPFPLPFPFDYSQHQQVNGAAPLTGLPPSFNITHEDLIHTANELYRRMADPEFGNDDAYWSSLPSHLRQFIRDAVPFTNPPPSAPNGLNNSQRALYAMAQQIVSAASQGMGLGQGAGAGLMANVTAVNGRPYPQPGIAEELGFRRHPDAKEEEYDDEEEFDLEEEHDYAAPNGDLPKKKNKKKKKKAGTVEPPPATLPPAAVKQPPRQPIPPQPPIQPSLNAPPPPLAPLSAHPPPSSRAAGKQPMANPPAPAANPPARSARAAGKAPVNSAPNPPNNNPHHGHTHNNGTSKTAGKGKAAVTAPPAKIWAQSTLEERENIRDFWLSLDENERRDLLQIEKDAVVRKMKEQHRHSCGCAVCGRKKVNIEMELDQLYEQYYDELENYASHQRAAAANGNIPAPLGPGPFPGSVELDANGQLTKMDHLAPTPHPAPLDPKAEESDDYEEDYDDDEEEVEEDELGSEEAELGEGDDLEEPRQPVQPPPRAPVRTKPQPYKPLAPKTDSAEDFLSFGSSLATIKGAFLSCAQPSAIFFFFRIELTLSCSGFCSVSYQEAY